MDPKEIVEALAKLEPDARATFLANLLEDQETLSGVLDKYNVTKTRLLTQSQVDKHVIPRAIKGKISRDEYEALQAEKDRLTADLEKAKKSHKSTENLEALKAQIEADYTKKIRDLTEAYQAAEQKAQKAELDRQEHLFQEALGKALIDAGVKGDKAHQARLIARTEIPNLRFLEANGDSRLTIVDPLTEQAKDPSEALRVWAQNNKHFCTPKPSGSGSERSTPGEPPPAKDWKNGKGESQQWGEAMAEFSMTGAGQTREDSNGDPDLR